MDIIDAIVDVQWEDAQWKNEAHRRAKCPDWVSVVRVGIGKVRGVFECWIFCCDVFICMGKGRAKPIHCLSHIRHFRRGHRHFPSNPLTTGPWFKTYSFAAPQRACSRSRVATAGISSSNTRAWTTALTTGNVSVLWRTGFYGAFIFIQNVVWKDWRVAHRRLWLWFNR